MMIIPMPHDTADVMLAPVALALDQQLDQLSVFSQEELAYHVTLSTDRPTTQDRRPDLMLQTIARDVQLHDWQLAWDPRGLRLTHNGHRIVLGLPASVREFLGD